MKTTCISIHEVNAYRYQTSIGPGGETLYHMPLEIESAADLRNYGITEDDCCRINFGGTDSRVVYFYKTPNRELAEDQWRYLNRDHSAKVAVTRCMIPGERKALKRCPTCNSCRQCPYGKTAADKQLNVISWERLTEEAWTGAKKDDSCAAEEIDDFNLLMDELQAELDKQDKRMTRALKMNVFEGYSAAEIAEELGCTPRQVYYLLERAKKRTKEWLTESPEEANGFFSPSGHHPTASKAAEKRVPKSPQRIDFTGISGRSVI